MNRSRIFLLLLILVSAIALAQIYKWVDEQGNVHFGDRPPEQGDVQELALPTGPSEEEIEAAQEKTKRSIETRQEREKITEQAAVKHAEEELAKKRRDEERFIRCVTAKYQVMLLKQKRRVFKLQADWSRNYLENEDRPAEISRLTRLTDKYCDNDPDSITKQFAHIEIIAEALDISCVNGREKIARARDPEADISKEELKKQTDYVEANCLDIRLDDLWIGDFVLRR